MDPHVVAPGRLDRVGLFLVAHHFHTLVTTLVLSLPSSILLHHGALVYEMITQH